MAPNDASSDPSRRRLLAAAAVAMPLLLGARAASLSAVSRALLGAQAGTDALLELGARRAVEGVKAGEFTAEELAGALLNQYRTHLDLNIAITVDRARVLESARAIDRARARGEALGPAAGLPFAVKDQIAVAGYPSTGGNRALQGHIPARHATVVQTLTDAGAIPFGMTSLPDMLVVDGLMHQASGHSDDFGAVRNPYDRDRVPGGSSGGNGAGLAARIFPAALGLDTNGSIRCPSAFCGVAGFRPSTYTMENALRGTSRKRYSDRGVMPAPVGRLDTIGPMARTVADAAFLDTLITGEPVPMVDLRSTRIAIPRPDYWERDLVDADVAAVILESFAKLRDAGCQLVEIDFPGEVRAIVGRIEAPTLASIFAAEGLGATRQSPESLEAWLHEHAPGVTIEQLYRGRPRRNGRRALPAMEEQIRILTEARARYADLYRTHRVAAIAFPTVPIVAPRVLPGGPKEPLGDLMRLNGVDVEEGRVLALNLFIAPRIGAPALSIPAGLARGLPVGLELDALPGSDSALLGLGIAVERALGRLPSPFRKG